MPLAVEDVMKLLYYISDAKHMKVTIKYSKRGAVAAGVVGCIGGYVAGPLGVAVGAAAGALLGKWINRGQCKPVLQILKELPPSEKEKLYIQVTDIVRYLDWKDAIQLTMLVMGSEALQKRLLAFLEAYLTKELHLNVQYGD